MKKGLIRLLYTGYLVTMLPLSLWWLWAAQTAVGRAIAVLGLIFTLLPYTLYQRHRHWNFPLIFTSIVIITGIFAAAPDGQSSSDSSVSHQFTSLTIFPRYNFANLIPEEEQFNLGWRIMPFIDPLLTLQQSRRAAVHALTLYDEMAQDPDFIRLGNVMGWAYDELLGRPFNFGHYYLYIPKNQSNRPLPAIVFLHGSAGNFKSYLWLWSKLAEQEGFAIIAPSFGFGNWRQEGGVSAVLNALNHANTLTNLDPDRIYLAGLSNGGLGVSLTANAAPERFRGLIFISPVFATEIVDRQPFLNTWQNKPILLVTGEQDKRIPIAYIRQQLTIWQEHNFSLTTALYANEDHFLLFTQANSVLGDISHWLHEN